MVYNTDSAKWKAYQFSDPFAAGAFFVCNKINKTFCRPDCDARPITNLKSEIKFVNSSADAIAYGYNTCMYCDPLNLPVVDVNLLIKCVTTVNKQIGFLSPLMDENEDKNNEKIKENIIESKKNEQVLRRSSVPVVNYEGKHAKDYDTTSISKNDSDHYRLVDLACRHLAMAATVSIFQSRLPKQPLSPQDSAASSPGKKRRRRGGVLGFKELAAKSKLSAWHFHRVFRSVTGLTPKTYGDKCSEFLKSVNAATPIVAAAPIAAPVAPAYTSSFAPSENSSSVYQTPVSNVPESESHTTSPETSVLGNMNDLDLDFIPNKRVKLEATQPQEYYSTRPQFKEGLLLSQPYNNSISLTQLSSLNVLTPPIITQDRVPSQATFDMNVPAPSANTINPAANTISDMAPLSGATLNNLLDGSAMYNIEDDLINNYLASTQTPQMPQAQPQAQLQQPMDTLFNHVKMDTLQPPSTTNNMAAETSPLSSVVPEENTNTFFFDSNDFGAQFMNTGYSEELSLPIEDFPTEMTNEIFVKHEL